MAPRAWDIQPTKKKPGAAEQLPASRTQARSSRPIELKRPAPVPKAEAVDEDAPVKASRRVRMPAAPLKARRKKARRRTQVLISLFLFILLASTSYLLWQPYVRVEQISVQGPDSAEAKQIAQQTLWGTYAGVLPRNSIFFFSSQHIRAAILAHFPNVEAVTITRSSFSSISITTYERATAFIWCGESLDARLPTCYDADAEGFLFATSREAALVAPADASSTAQTHQVPSGTLRVFSPLAGSTTEATSSPVGSSVSGAHSVPNALAFVKAVRALGAPVSSLALAGDEATLWLTESASRTRITYVLGHEAQALTLAQAALPTLPLTDGTIEYVDLRFGDRAYVMRYGSRQATVTNTPAVPIVAPGAGATTTASSSAH